MFTGLLPFEHKVRDNLGFTLAAGMPTLASLFKAAGYHTGGFASAFVLRPDTGVAQGFDFYDATLPPAGADQAPAEILRAGPATLAAATKWLDTQADGRFFLFFHIYEPHAPYTPPSRFAMPDPYDGEVAYADEIVGQLFDVLRRRQWYDSATIVFTADHGEGLDDHGEKEHGLFVYEETIRVPLAIKRPHQDRGGSRTASLVQHIDLLPMLAEMAGFTPPAGVRGRSLQPLLTGRGAIAPQGVYAEALYPRYHFGWSELTTLVEGRYKLIKAPRSELYDLERDPRERENIIDARVQQAAALRTGLDQLIAGRPVDAPGAVSAEDRQRLAALGYVGAGSSVSAATSG
jgi:arylsulfatase A-like enzyme